MDHITEWLEKHPELSSAGIEALKESVPCKKHKRRFCCECRYGKVKED